MDERHTYYYDRSCVLYYSGQSGVKISHYVFAVVSSNGKYQDVCYRAFARECPFDV